MLDALYLFQVYYFRTVSRNSSRIRTVRATNRFYCSQAQVLYLLYNTFTDTPTPVYYTYYLSTLTPRVKFKFCFQERAFSSHENDSFSICDSSSTPNDMIPFLF